MVSRSYSRTRFVQVVAVLATLAGCAPTSTDYSPAEARTENEVVWVNLTHEVGFAPGTLELSGVEQLRLDQFLGQVSATHLDALTIDPGAPVDAVAEARINAISDHLRERVPAAQPGVRSIGLEPGARDILRVVVGRYIVVPPDCPNWGQPSNRNPGNLQSSNFGCATTVNLGLMAADPGDLIRGRPLSPADGAAASLAIERYRAGEVFVPESATDGGGLTEVLQ
ncbi:MAG: CpaD family pilus assembly lipoprotein [Alphaproteobacteria bacterium]